MFTSDSTIDATVGGRSGSLLVKNAGATQGTFSAADGGRSQYEGTLCLP